MTQMYRLKKFLSHERRFHFLQYLDIWIELSNTANKSPPQVNGDS